MNHHHLAHSLLKQGPGCMTEGHGVQATIRSADLEPGGFASLDLVKDAIVDVPERGTDDFRKAVAIFADYIHAGLYTGLLGSREQTGGFCAELRIGLIERVQQQKIAEVKNTGSAASKIQIG